VAVTPATVLREHLAAARRAGSAFEGVFTDSLAAALEVADPGQREDWHEVLDAMTPTSRAAFDRRPVGHDMTALIDASRAPAPDRPFRQCGGQVPMDRGKPGAPAIYCSTDCNALAARERERQARMQRVAA
jgi:hypothetical protein